MCFHQRGAKPNILKEVSGLKQQKGVRLIDRHNGQITKVFEIAIILFLEA